MRELKFRLWNKIGKSWENPSILEVFGDDGILRPIYSGNPINENWQDEYVICQYTGLKGKNGKEIYEDDIVRGMNIISYSNEDKIYCSGIVKYKHCGFVAVPFGMEEFNMVALGEWCEVIGNVYENPELMELWSDE